MNVMALEWGSGGGRWDNQGVVVGGGVGDYLSPLYVQLWVQERRRQPGTMWRCAGGVYFPPATAPPLGRHR